MRILGIDPGLRCTGYGVIDVAGREQLHYIGSGVIRTPSTADLPERLEHIVMGIGNIADQYQPEQAVIEKVFVNVNPVSTLLLGQARGAALAALIYARLPIAEYTALQIKQAVAGHGKARKDAVQEMVRRLLHLSEAPGTDSADALAAIICHVQHRFTPVQGDTLRHSKLQVRRGRWVSSPALSASLYSDKLAPNTPSSPGAPKQAPRTAHSKELP